MPFNVGENVNPYRILEQLGQGGMATVFKAYHASLDWYLATIARNAVRELLWNAALLDGSEYLPKNSSQGHYR